MTLHAICFFLSCHPYPDAHLNRLPWLWPGCCEHLGLVLRSALMSCLWSVLRLVLGFVLRIFSEGWSRSTLSTIINHDASDDIILTDENIFNILNVHKDDESFDK